MRLRGLVISGVGILVFGPGSWRRGDLPTTQRAAGRAGGCRGSRSSYFAVADACTAIPEGLEFFERKVRPLLAQRCLECHSGDHAKGSLRLDSKAGVLAGGDTGPAVVPGKPGESLLVDAVNYGETYQMPPKSKLASDEVAVLTRWVEIGAPWPEEADSAKVSRTKFDLAERRAAHWAWQPIASPDPAGGCRRRLAAGADRPLYSGPAGAGGIASGRGGRPGGAGAAALLRPDWFAAKWRRVGRGAGR